MKIKESPKESVARATPKTKVFIPSTIEPYVTAHEKAWEREMRHRLAILENWADQLEQRITALEETLKAIQNRGI